MSAHVTLCVLALALQRCLEQKLERRYSAEAVIEVLATCHLNQCAGAGENALPVYSVTEADQEQLALLRQLRLTLLTDNAHLGASIAPRVVA